MKIVRLFEHGDVEAARRIGDGKVCCMPAAAVAGVTVGERGPDVP